MDFNSDEFKENKNRLIQKLNDFMANEGFDNFEISRLDVQYDCNIITDEYCYERGMKRKRVKKNGEWKCYCVLSYTSK